MSAAASFRITGMPSGRSRRPATGTLGGHASVATVRSARSASPARASPHPYPCPASSGHCGPGPRRERCSPTAAARSRSGGPARRNPSRRMARSAPRSRARQSLPPCQRARGQAGTPPAGSRGWRQRPGNARIRAPARRTEQARRGRMHYPAVTGSGGPVESSPLRTPEVIEQRRAPHQLTFPSSTRGDLTRTAAPCRAAAWAGATGAAPAIAERVPDSSGSGIARVSYPDSR